MDILWHKLQLKCPECNTDIKIISTYVARDGDVTFNCQCKCGKEFSFLTDMGRMLTFCRKGDSLAHEAKQTLARISAPLLTSEDLKLLKEMHIEGGRDG